MSIETKAAALTNALIDVMKEIANGVNAIAEKAEAAPTTTEAGPGAGEKKTTKKELAELKKAAKAKAGSVMKKHGKEKLAEVLADFGADKFSELKNEPDLFKNFIEKAEAALAEEPVTGDDDDLLGDGPEEPEATYTVEDVKGLLLKVNNADGLGRDTTRQILADLGVARLPELKAEKYAEAVEKITAVLKDAGVE